MLVVFAANIIQAITGFAGTLLAMPASIMLVGLPVASAVLNLMGMLSSFWIMLKNRKHIQYKQFLRIVLLMGVGMVCGRWMLMWAPTRKLLTGYGIFILVIACYKLLARRQLRVPEWLYPLVLAAAGVIHGMFVSGGSLLVIYAAAKLPGKNEFRATLSAVWVILNGVMLLAHVRAGMWDLPTVKLAVLCVPVLVMGVWIGGNLQRHISQQRFLTLTYLLLLISGIFILR